MCTYIRMYVSITLGNVNSWYCLGMSICAHARQDIGYVHYTTMSAWCFLVTKDGQDSAAGPLQCTYSRTQVHKWVLNIANGWRLGEKKAYKSVHCKSQESDRRTRFQKQKACIGDSSQARYLGSLFTLPLFCTVLWTPTKRATPDICAAHSIHAWCLEQRKASYACIVLVYYVYEGAVSHTQVMHIYRCGQELRSAEFKAGWMKVEKHVFDEFADVDSGCHSGKM